MAGHAMTQTLRAGSKSIRLPILPHRSLTGTGLCLFLALQGVAMAVFAGLAAWCGGVFAPYFALLGWGVLAYVLSRVWRRSAVGEVITLNVSGLEVARMGGPGPSVRFHPGWVRVALLPGRHVGWASRLLLRSHGREVEVGRFLTEAERVQLARRLNEMLVVAKRQGMSD